MHNTADVERHVAASGGALKGIDGRVGMPQKSFVLEPRFEATNLLTSVQGVRFSHDA